MARLIDANALKSQITRYHMSLTPRYISKLVDAEIGDVIDIIDETPTVDAYTAEQVAQIIKQADKLAAKANELEKEVVWLKSCLNCKIRNVCPGHCGKVVHGCDHWEYGNNAVEVVHGYWVSDKADILFHCSECETQISTDWDYDDLTWNYCPNCGAKMDLEGE